MASTSGGIVTGTTGCAEQFSETAAAGAAVRRSIAHTATMCGSRGQFELAGVSDSVRRRATGASANLLGTPRRVLIRAKPQVEILEICPLITPRITYHSLTQSFTSGLDLVCLARCWRGTYSPRAARAAPKPGGRPRWRSNELGDSRPRRHCRAGPCAVRPAAERIGCEAPIEERRDKTIKTAHHARGYALTAHGLEIVELLWRARVPG